MHTEFYEVKCYKTDMSRVTRIGQWSLKYYILTFLVKLSYYVYYRKISIINKKKLKVDGSVILAPNHQGALMDAFALIFGLRKQIIFLARADIFKKPLVIRILNYMKILPAYRSRDGRENLQKNDEVFDTTSQILHSNKIPLCIFPEGSLGDKRRLRPLVKGIFRISFQTQEQFGAEKAVKIFPIGIDYGHYQKFRTNKLVIVGDPIEVSDYWQEYTENPAVAINSLRNKLAAELSKIMIDIQTEEYYDLYMGLRKIYNKKMCNRLGLNFNRHYDQFTADKKMIDALNICLQQNNAEIEIINNQFKEYSSLRDKLNYRDWVPSKAQYSIIGNIAALLFSIPMVPIFILGLFNNWPHFFIPPRKFKNLKDPQFISTAKWAMAFVIFPLYYIPLVILALNYFPFWWLKVIYIATFIQSGIVALDYRNFIIKTFARIRYSYNMKRKDRSTSRLKEMYDNIIQSIDRIVEKYL